MVPVRLGHAERWRRRGPDTTGAQARNRPIGPRTRCQGCWRPQSADGTTSRARTALPGATSQRLKLVALHERHDHCTPRSRIQSRWEPGRDPMARLDPGRKVMPIRPPLGTATASIRLRVGQARLFRHHDRLLAAQCNVHSGWETSGLPWRRL